MAERPDDVEHAAVVKVNARDRVGRLWNVRFFFDLQHPLALKHRHAEPLRVFHFFQKNLRPHLLLAKDLGGTQDVAFDHIIDE